MTWITISISTCTLNKLQRKLLTESISRSKSEDWLAVTMAIFFLRRWLERLYNIMLQLTLRALDKSEIQNSEFFAFESGCSKRGADWGFFFGGGGEGEGWAGLLQGDVRFANTLDHVIPWIWKHGLGKDFTFAELCSEASIVYQSPKIRLFKLKETSVITIQRALGRDWEISTLTSQSEQSKELLWVSCCLTLSSIVQRNNDNDNNKTVMWSYDFIDCRFGRRSN